MRLGHRRSCRRFGLPAAASVLGAALCASLVSIDGAGAQTEGRVASFSATADAVGVFYTFDQENLLPLSPIVATGGPRAQVVVDSLPRLFGRGTPFDPGVLATVGGATGLAIGGVPLFALAPPVAEGYEQAKKVFLPLLPDNPVPPWPFFADSATPGGDRQAATGFGPVFYGRAATTDEAPGGPASPYAAAAEAGLAGLQLAGADGSPYSGFPPLSPGNDGGVEGSERTPHVIRLSGVRTVSHGVGGDATGAESLVEIADVSLLNGYLHLEGVRSLAQAAAGTAPTASFKAERVTVAGRPAALTEEGLRLLGPDQAGGQAGASVNEMLKELGLELHLTQVSSNDDGTAVAGLAVRFARQLLPADIPGVIVAGEDRVTLHIGFASASAAVTRVAVHVGSDDFDSGITRPVSSSHQEAASGPTGGDGVRSPSIDSTTLLPSRSPFGASGPAARVAGGSSEGAAPFPALDQAVNPRGDASSTTGALTAPAGASSRPEATEASALPSVQFQPAGAVARARLDFRWSVLVPALVGVLGLLALRRLARPSGASTT